MKTEKVNTEKGKANVCEKKTSPKKEAWGTMLIGLALFIAFSLFFIFFYRPFVPWKKIVCEKEIRPNITENAGTCIFDEDIKEVTYFYEFNGIKYKKVFDMRTIPYQKWPFEDVPYTIYVNLNNPTDVKPGNRGGGFFIFVNWMFIIVGGYMTGWGIYKFHRIKIQKKN